jgi:hypothetical protein
MGYQTRHRLKIIQGEFTARDLRKFAKTDPGEHWDYLLKDLRGESIKWYEHKQDMTRLSKAFPDIVFCLCGKGEDAGDVWREYYKNGRMHRCQAKLRFEKFDPTKL